MAEPVRAHRTGDQPLLTPVEWEHQLSIKVLDPDGWREDGKSYDDPVDEAEFRRRAALSTSGRWNFAIDQPFSDWTPTANAKDGERVAHLEARVGELCTQLGDARARALPATHDDPECRAAFLLLRNLAHERTRERDFLKSDIEGWRAREAKWQEALDRNRNAAVEDIRILGELREQLSLRTRERDGLRFHLSRVVNIAGGSWDQDRIEECVEEAARRIDRMRLSEQEAARELELWPTSTVVSGETREGRSPFDRPVDPDPQPCRRECPPDPSDSEYCALWPSCTRDPDTDDAQEFQAKQDAAFTDPDYEAKHSDCATAGGVCIERHDEPSPVPRVWEKGAPTPEDVEEVSDCYGNRWHRQDRGYVWQRSGTGAPHDWPTLLGEIGPLTEVLPSESSSRGES